MSLFQFQFVMNEQKLTTSEPTIRFIFRVPILFLYLYLRHQCFIDKLALFHKLIKLLYLMNWYSFVSLSQSAYALQAAYISYLPCCLWTELTIPIFGTFRLCHPLGVTASVTASEWQFNLSGTVWIILFVAKECEFLSGNIGSFFVVKGNCFCQKSLRDALN